MQKTVRIPKFFKTVNGPSVPNNTKTQCVIVFADGSHVIWLVDVFILCSPFVFNTYSERNTVYN